VSLDEYLVRGGYQGLANALNRSPEEVIADVLKADLRGRGGAYFPAARKWQGARAVNKTPRYIVVNAEEGEPGIFKDRHIMEGVPHRLIEGLLIAGYATGAARGYVYINAEADLSAERVEAALAQARERGIVGQHVLGGDLAFEIEVRRGAGGYVCGEETTLLNTIEGERRVPRLRPPFPVEAGLWARPTVINNVETLCNVPFIMANGADAYRAIGKGAPGTKLVSLSGAVQRPGLAEVPMGTTLRQIVYEIGGGPRPGRRVVAVVAGGPSGGILPEAMLDAPIGPGRLHESGAVLGSGGIVVVDDTMPVPQVVRHLAAYNAAESCGKCTPCREGTPRMAQALDRLLGGTGRSSDLDELRELTEIVAAASLCGLGQMAGGPVTSGLHFFGEEFSKLAQS
jgi:NADH:ubiquinone oxidoreductase subunit F (NADH-binding)